MPGSGIDGEEADTVFRHIYINVRYVLSRFYVFYNNLIVNLLVGMLYFKLYIKNCNRKSYNKKL